ncbi:MAG TPA: hypothetical protein DGL25_00120 [Dehalococcoidia bacterium]|nr:hypothetical protein [Dehalococcoidia bacterium]|tara:strand:- start:25254 stop:25775 length:522 start_codon:yes stop_codon:yes gene_type:complete
MTEPSRRRITIPTEREESSQRRGCLRIAAILGIIVGLPAGILGVPAALNFFFDEATVTTGGTYSDSEHVITIAHISSNESVDHDKVLRSIEILLNVEAKEVLIFDSNGATLELANGEHILAKPKDLDPPRQLRKGERFIFSLSFTLSKDQQFNALFLHLEDPDVRFELTESEE